MQAPARWDEKTLALACGPHGRDPLIFLDAEEHMIGLATVSDKDGPLRGGLFGPTGVLIKLPAG